MPTDTMIITYGGITIGGSSGRQITDYEIEEASWDVSAFEFEFIIGGFTTDATFQAEVAALRNAFRTPRQDLVVTQNGATMVSWKQSNNTGFDCNPRIVKDGDQADTAFSRHFRIRLEFGQPADRIGSVNFRRYSTVSVSYSPERIRTISISGVYTANSTDGTTGSFSQYRNDIISSYGPSVTQAVDPSASWEVIGEPTVERNETDKVTQFTIVYREVIHNQSSGTLDDQSIVDPVMTIVKERVAPGDSTQGGFSFSASSGGGTFSTGSGGADTGVMVPTTGAGSTTTAAGLTRPTRIVLTYAAGIDITKTKGLTTLWTSKIRSFLISEAARVAGDAVVLIKEDPGYEDYGNRINATLEFLAYTGVTKFEQTITVSDKTAFGRVLSPVTSPDVYAYYDRPGPALRQRIVNIKYKQVVGSADPNSLLDSMIEDASTTVSGIANASGWVPISSAPAVGVITQGLDGGTSKLIAEVTIERVAQRRNKVTASVANAGGVTGAGLTST